MLMLRMNDATEGLARIQAQLIDELAAGKRVLWLLSGGSNIAGSTHVMADIPYELTENLTLALSDERYGPEGHADSNWLQLESAGFDPKQGRQVKVLLSPAESLKDTAQDYNNVLQELFAEHDTIIAQLGMGEDGHIAGLLPESSAIDAEGYVVGYQSTQYARISMTFTALRQCSIIYVFVFGAAKRPMLQKLAQDLPLSIQPAQILKQLPEVYICNDQIGDIV